MAEEHIAIPKQQGLAALGRAAAKMAMPQAKMKDQSRQAIETKGSAQETKSWMAGATARHGASGAVHRDNILTESRGEAAF